MVLLHLIMTKGMWCGFPMKITRCGYTKLIEQLKAKLEKRNEERNKLERYHEGNDQLVYFPARLSK